MCKNAENQKSGDIEAKTRIYAGGLPGLGWVWRGLKTCVKWLKRLVSKRSVQAVSVPTFREIFEARIKQIKEYELQMRRLSFAELDPVKETPTAEKKKTIMGVLKNISCQQGQQTLATIEVYEKGHYSHQRTGPLLRNWKIIDMAVAEIEIKGNPTATEILYSKLVMAHVKKDVARRRMKEPDICFSTEAGNTYMTRQGKTAAVDVIKLCDNCEQKNTKKCPGHPRNICLSWAPSPSADPLGDVLGEIGRQMAAEADIDSLSQKVNTGGTTVAAMGIGYFNQNEF